MVFDPVPNLTALSYRRAPLVSSTLDPKTVPSGFPMAIWSNQWARYRRYWDWFTGDVLDEMVPSGVNGKKSIHKYPLRINPIFNFAWKHAAILLGEEVTDTPYAFAKMNCTPKTPLDDKDAFEESDKKLARVCRNVVNEVWAHSHGRSIQMENAVLQQFLGGCVFQVKYHGPRSKKRKQLRIPVSVKNVLPDFFVPIWNGEDFWDLTEAYVVYRIPRHVALTEYPYHYKVSVNDDPLAGQGINTNTTSASDWVVYCEHWQRDEYSIYLDGRPLKEVYSEPGFKPVEVVYDHLNNPFGFVPFVYIPHIRSGDFHGFSMVDDLAGQIIELNARMTDVGDNMRDTVKRRRYATDLSRNSKQIQLDDGTWATDLGPTNITTKATPRVSTEDPAVMSDALANYPQMLWDQLLRDGNLSNISFGEDDVSQRSAIALAMRMFPTTAHSRAERTFWTEGLILIAHMILRICVIKKDEIGDFKLDIPEDFERLILLAVDWLPQIPRDREQQVNEMILRKAQGLVSLETALKTLGDSDYISEEVERIRRDLMFQAQLSSMGATPGKNAPSKITSPEATDGMDD